MSEQHRLKKACLWMIRYYMRMANECKGNYEDLSDFYLMYDHYMTYVENWERRLENICNDNIRNN